jgi:leucyl-tRNA synthetase
MDNQVKANDPRIVTDEYNPEAVETKWQDRWREQRTNVTDIDGAPDPFYALMMFPYPSAEGLHVGNLFAFVGNDIYGRFQRLQGHNVFEPRGYDAFGIHSENYALKVGQHPTKLIPSNITNFRRQLERAGLMVDWTRSLATTDPDYYKWTQWVFLQLLKKGLAYKKQAAVNWCPSCKTVLANEQVIGGRCERCDTPVEQRQLEQWFFRISDYAGRLLGNLDHLDWSESTKTAQRNWIGRSEGAEIDFPVETAQGAQHIRVFTTRPDTVFGATYIVLSPEHPLVDKLTLQSQRTAVEEYLERTSKKDLVTRKTTTEKTGVFTGSYALNPATGNPIPVWVADYVLMEYGTGAIMAVPGHDERDWEFAMVFGLPIVRVVCAEGDDPSADFSSAYTGMENSRLVNSGEFSGLSPEVGKKAIVDELATKVSPSP